MVVGGGRRFRPSLSLCFRGRYGRRNRGVVGGEVAKIERLLGLLLRAHQVEDRAREVRGERRELVVGDVVELQLSVNIGITSIEKGAPPSNAPASSPWSGRDQA